MVKRKNSYYNGGALKKFKGAGGLARRGGSALRVPVGRRLMSAGMRGLTRAIPYVGNAVAAYDAYKAVTGYLGSGKKTKKGKKARRARGIVGDSKYRGAFGSGGMKAPASLSYSKLNGRTMANIGVEFNMEQRFLIGGSTGAGSQEESVRVGHYTMPYDLTMKGVNRALIKALWGACGVQIASFQDKQLAKSGDNVVLYYYPSLTSTTLSTISTNCDSNGTYEVLADTMYNNFKAVITDSSQIRWYKVELVPDITYSNISIRKVTINLETCKVHIKVKSVQKIQNRSVTLAADDQTDEVTRVPVSGRIYELQGNNLVHVASRVAATRTGSFQLRDAYLQDVPLSEPVPSYEYLNCKLSKKISIEPGDIKSSYISEYKVYSFGTLIRLLAFGNGMNSPNNYNPKLGKCRLIHLEKTVGDTSSGVSGVRLWVEGEFKQQVAITYKKENITEVVVDQDQI